jgi:hypothetical protein
LFSVSVQNEKDEIQKQLTGMWVTIPLLSLFQIVRNPTFVKNLLRPIRVGLGPTSFLWTVATSGLQIKAETDKPEINYFVVSLSLVSGLCSFLAIVIFRPDNTQLFGKLFPANIESVWPLKSRTKFHGCLNLVAVFISTAIYFYFMLALN